MLSFMKKKLKQLCMYLSVFFVSIKSLLILSSFFFFFFCLLIFILFHYLYTDYVFVLFVNAKTRHKNRKFKISQIFSYNF